MLFWKSKHHVVLPLALAACLGCGGGHGGGGGGQHQPPPPPLNITLQGWYLTQAIQKLDRSVPLVAKRDGLLRVFLRANTANQVAPSVRVTLTGGAGAPWQRTIPAPKASVTTAFAESDLASSWNLPIPGNVLAEHGHIQLEVDPDGATAGIAAAARNIQSALDVRRAAIMRITLVPVTQSGLTGEITGNGRTLQSWVARFRALFPVPQHIDVQVAPTPLVTTANLNQGGHGWAQLHGELEHLRQADELTGAVGRYYYGVVKRSNGLGTLGETPVQSHVAAGWDGPNYQDTFAHEMGHALGMAHAPCGLGLPAGHPVYGLWPNDPAHADAQLGAAGMDVAARSPKPATAFKDIMSYCPPYWVSDHTYTFIMNYREENPFYPAY